MKVGDGTGTSGQGYAGDAGRETRAAALPWSGAARALRRWFATAACVLLAALAAGEAPARSERAGPGPDIAVSELPPQAVRTLELIRQGGPFPYRKDGVVFLNRERRLPARPRGYYSEYTVKTPGSRDRGARRIIAGKGDTGDPRTSGEYWYTADHYETFRRIREQPQ